MLMGTLVVLPQGVQARQFLLEASAGQRLVGLDSLTVGLDVMFESRLARQGRPALSMVQSFFEAMFPTCRATTFAAWAAAICRAAISCCAASDDSSS